MLKLFKKIIEKEKFNPKFIGIFFNPFFLIRRSLYKSIKKYANNFKGKILDFGCGTKPYEKLFKNATHYIGLESKESVYKYKDSIIDKYYSNNTIPYDDDFFDNVVSFEVFQHIEDIEKIIKELKRVTKNGGKFLISIPFFWGEHGVPYDFQRWTSFGILKLLKRNELEIINHEKTMGEFLTICQLFISYLYDRTIFKKAYQKYILQILFILPFTLFTLIFNLFMPKSYNFYSNLIIFCKVKKN